MIDNVQNVSNVMNHVLLSYSGMPYELGQTKRLGLHSRSSGVHPVTIKVELPGLDGGYSPPSSTDKAHTLMAL
jgi:hypothetical protein